MILTKYFVNLYETCFSLTGKHGKPVRVFGFALACWEFPNPFSHFVWLRVSAKRWIALDVIRQKNKKIRSQIPIKSASDSGCPFVVFMVLAQVYFQKRHVLKNLRLFFVFSLISVPCFMRLSDSFFTDSYTDNGAICYFHFVFLSAIIAAT